MKTLRRQRELLERVPLAAATEALYGCGVERFDVLRVGVLALVGLNSADRRRFFAFGPFVSSTAAERRMLALVFTQSVGKTTIRVEKDGDE